MTCLKFSLFLVLIITSYMITSFYLVTSHYTLFKIANNTCQCFQQHNEFILAAKWNQSFEGFDNVAGTDRFIVPNIVHFVRFNNTQFTFIDYIVIKAAMRNQRPDYFYIHTDTPGPGNFIGRYWNLIQKDYEIGSRIRLLHLEAPTEIFGQKFNESVPNVNNVPLSHLS